MGKYFNRAGLIFQLIHKKIDRSRAEGKYPRNSKSPGSLFGRFHQQLTVSLPAMTLFDIKTCNLGAPRFIRAMQSHTTHHVAVDCHHQKIIKRRLNFLIGTRHKVGIPH